VPPEPKGARVTKLGRRSYQNVITTHKSSFEIGGTPVHAISDGETDVEAIDNGYTSITPISLDLVDYNIFKELSSLNEGLRKKWPKQRNA
jgi:broad specificity polyphosphatase/5'/3'-nucleotidase SurE